MSHEVSGYEGADTEDEIGGEAAGDATPVEADENLDRGDSEERDRDTPEPAPAEDDDVPDEEPPDGPEDAPTAPETHDTQSRQDAADAAGQAAVSHEVEDSDQVNREGTGGTGGGAEGQDGSSTAGEHRGDSVGPDGDATGPEDADAAGAGDGDPDAADAEDADTETNDATEDAGPEDDTGEGPSHDENGGDKTEADDAAEPVEPEDTEADTDARAGGEDEEAQGGELDDVDEWEKEIEEHEQAARENGKGDPPERDLGEMEELLHAMDPDAPVSGRGRQLDEEDDSWANGRDAAGNGSYDEDDGHGESDDNDGGRDNVIPINGRDPTHEGSHDHETGGPENTNGDGGRGSPVEEVDADEVIRGLGSVEEFIKEEFDGRNYPPEVVAAADEFEARGDYDGAYGVLLAYEQTGVMPTVPEPTQSPEQTSDRQLPDDQAPALF
jgi:hypothetical protein